MTNWKWIVSVVLIGMISCRKNECEELPSPEMVIVLKDTEGTTIQYSVNKLVLLGENGDTVRSINNGNGNAKSTVFDYFKNPMTNNVETRTRYFFDYSDSLNTKRNRDTLDIYYTPLLLRCGLLDLKYLQVLYNDSLYYAGSEKKISLILITK